MSYIVLPSHVSLSHWGNSLKRSLTTLNIPTPPVDEKDWHAWAHLLIAINNLNYITLPDKNKFPNPKDWKKWAFLFIKNYNLTAA